MSLWSCPDHGLYAGDVFCPQCGQNGSYTTISSEPDSGIVRVPEDGVACQTPLNELLRRVPADARLQWTEMDGLRAHHFVPIGKMSHEAADRIEALLRDKAALDAKVADLERMLGVARVALFAMVGRVEHASNMHHNSQHWHDEDAPDASGTLWDWVFAPAHSALAQSGRPLNDDKEI